MSDGEYRPGLEGIVAGETAISTLSGGLQYRGYAINDLANHATFDETAYLLLEGQLPERDELATFRQELQDSAVIPEALAALLRSLPRDVNLMDVLRTSASALAHWDADAADNSRAANLRKAKRLLVQLPLALTSAVRAQAGKAPVQPDLSLGLAGNFLWMLTGTRPGEEARRALDVSLILYAEHEFNASTFAARVVCSTMSDLHSSVTAAIGALKGPLHGGANERVLEVLEEVGSPDRAEHWVRQALDKKRRIMGFGHRVYKEGDVRAEYLRPLCAALAAATGHQGMEETAATIERIVREEKGLSPNLDWPSARLYRYLGLEVRLYTPLFVLSRVAGWCAHVMEQLENNRLIRPRSRYIGPGPRTWARR
jgi:citrate synthase